MLIRSNRNGSFVTAMGLEASYACPMNVRAGDTAVQFAGEVATTGPGVSYEVEIRYASGTTGGSLEHTGLTTSIGSWNASTGTDETLLLLSVTVTPAQPLQWTADLVAKAPGTVSYVFQTRQNGFLRRDEACTFEVVGLPGSFSGIAFLDIDSDGQQQPEEPGLPGWQVYVDGNGNRQYDFGTDSVRPADGVGQYTFDNQQLPVDLGLVVPDDWDQTFPVGGFHTISEDGADANFGARPKTNSILGAKWEDLDEDGKLEPGEPLLPGWTIYLDTNGNNALDAGEPSTVTDEFGRYQFTGLSDNAYVVREVQQKPFAQTFPNDPSVPFGDEHVAVLSENQIAAGRSFGNFRLASIHGLVFETKDPDLSQDEGEFGVDGVVVRLRKATEGSDILDRTTTMSMDLDGDGTIDPATEQGLYWFEGLEAGTYIVEFDAIPEGFREAPGAGPVSVAHGQRLEGQQRAITTLAELSGVKKGDRVGRGDPDDFDTYSKGPVPIQLLDAVTGQVLATNTTVLGFYSFDVEPGKAYIVREVVPEGVVQTFPSEKTYTVTPGSGEEVGDLDFANEDFQVSIRGRKFEDLNGDGEIEASDRGLNGWTIRIVGIDVPVNLSVVTTNMDLNGDGDPEPGAYLVEGLPAGAYLISEVEQDDFRRTYPGLSSFVVDLAPIATLRGVDFANQRVDNLPISDAGDGEALREAIEESNALPPDAPPRRIKLEGGGQQIQGGQYGIRGRQATIRPGSPLPPITRPLIIDGGGTIILDGSDAGADAHGLVISGGGTDIVGLTITNFQGHGVVLQDEGRNRVENSVLSHNGGSGIYVASGTNNAFNGNAIFGDGGPGIDVGGDGPTANDAGEGDGVQNYPVIHAVVSDTTLRIEGTFISTPDTTYLLEFFAGDACAPPGNGEGERFLGTHPVFTDSTGQASFSARFDTTLAGQQFITATATSMYGNTSEFSPCLGVGTVIDVVEPVEWPERIILHQNYPNPFNPVTTIRFDFPERSAVRLTLYDLLGREVAVLVDGELFPGQHEVVFDAGRLASGIYVYRLEGGGSVQTRMLTLLK